MATKRHKFLSPPGQCIEIFNDGSMARLIKTAPQHLAGAAQAEQSNLMHIAFSLLGCGADSDDLTWADEDEEEMLEMPQLLPFLKR